MLTRRRYAAVTTCKFNLPILYIGEVTERKYRCQDVLLPCLWIPLYRPISYTFRPFIPYTGHGSKPLSSEDTENKGMYDVVAR